MKPHKSMLEKEIELEFNLVKCSSDSDIIEGDLEQKLKNEALFLLPEKIVELDELFKNMSGVTIDLALDEIEAFAGWL